MARLQKDVVNYFPHDANACASDTLTVLQSRFGNDGYAFWFKLLEKLASTDGHYIDCRNSTKWQLLLAKTGVNEITGVEIMKLLVEIQAIDKELWESKLIWCQKLVDNIADVYKNRRRERPLKPVITEKKEITTGDNPLNTDDENPLPPHTPPTPKSKVKETKVEESKETTSSHLFLINKLQGWKIDLKEDQEWLKEFLTDFPDFTVNLLKACRDHWSGKKLARNKGDWKKRFRNWTIMQRKIDSEQQLGARASNKPGEDTDKYIKGRYGHMVRR